ncbi:carbohydrate kinase [Rhizobium sp. L1K21]|uniref:carbohydrate kinase n=1 Tax=Rhizobium sp. L1K21 TaxID=2954933 RepID=UPI002092EDB6|nr:carbohydrate kinase [Rhizobium sp. L1K21]MCO6187635.1 winged helix-turn-helix transcriptional regulator [Rhizobium sp. L1K21]
MKTELSAQEAAVLEIIRANPFAGQQEIAGEMGLARSTIAAHIVQLIQKGYLLGRGYLLPDAQRAVCVGGAVLDRKYHAHRPLIEGTSNPVNGSRSFGGVARNVAENLALLGTPTSFVSIVGDDETGRQLLRHLRDRGVDVSQVITSSEKPTAEYAAVLDPAGDLAYGIADMGIFDLFAPAHLDRIWPHLASASWVFADCNLPGETLQGLISRKHAVGFKLAVDAVSTPKVAKLPQSLNGIDLIFMNLDEARAYLKTDFGSGPEAAKKAAQGLLAAGAGESVVSIGSNGIAVANGQRAAAFPAVTANVVDITGAGDAMIAGTLHNLLSGENIFTAARIGALIGTLTTESDASVCSELSENFVRANMHRMPA